MKGLCAMTDDIAIRLRNWDDQQPPFRIMVEAADEIERLRKAGDALAEGIRTGRWDDALDAWTEVRDD